MYSQINNNLKVLIVDDEKPARDEMTFLLKGIEDITISGVAENGEEALKIAGNVYPDIIFLDINMAEMNGFQLTEKLHATGQNPGIIFTTAYDQYALQAFDIRAVDYILKPVEEDRLISSIEKFRSQRGGGNDRRDYSALEQIIKRLQRDNKVPRYLSIGLGDSYLPVSFGDIITISARGRTVTIHTKKGDYRHCRSIGEMEDLLSDGNFFRCHRSYIINLDFIEKIGIWFNNTYQIQMKHFSEKITVSRSYIKAFREIMSIV
ncbi:MAG: response regulator transcription factor [Spirochaetales bacterium]|nr:response regulator transcription factor [Spirochaetales bacterium]